MLIVKTYMCIVESIESSFKKSAYFDILKYI